MITNNRLTPQRVQNNSTTFGAKGTKKAQLPKAKLTERVKIFVKDVFTPGTKAAKKSSNGLLMALVCGLGICTIYDNIVKAKGAKTEEAISKVAPKDTAKIFARASLLPSNREKSVYLQQVNDSLQGKKVTPNKNFKIESLIDGEAARLNHQADSVKAESDTLRAQAAKYLRLKK